MTGARTRVLIVYYSFTQQNRKVSEVIAAALRELDCEVTLAAIELTDERYLKHLSTFPLKHRLLDVLAMLPAQLRRATGEIATPDEACHGEYDLVCIGSATWWLTTCLPIRSYLVSDDARRVLAGKSFAAFVVCRRYWRGNLKSVRKLAGACGADYLGEMHFVAAGGQVRSLLSLISYLGTGEDRPRSLGIPIPPANLQPGYPEQARTFAAMLIAQLPTATAGARPELSRPNADR